MPIYDYQCERCGETTEVLQRVSDPPLERCPRCKGPVRKRPSAPAFQFRGSGWYVTDYARKERDGKRASARGGEGDDAAGTRSGGEASGGAAEKGDATADQAAAKAKKSDPPSASVLALLALTLLGSAAIAAQELGPAFRPAGVAVEKATVAPSYLGEALEVEPLARMEPAATAAPAQLAALAAWNRDGGLPLQDGFARPLPRPRIVALTAALLEGDLPRPHAGGVLDIGPRGELVWTARVEVRDAFALRLGLSEVDLPRGTRLWVYRPGGLARRSYGLDLVDPHGNLWLPAVEDGSVWLEVAVPTAPLLAGAGHGFVLREVVELFQLDGRGEPVTGRHVVALDEAEGCTVDGGCIDDAELPGIGAFRSAVARLAFLKGGQSFRCTGALLNNTAEDFRPLLLTAHHCFSTEASATSLTATFDFHSTVCDGPVDGQVVQVSGATLLATGPDTDFTLVELAEAPPGERWFLGWNANLSALSDGVVLHRLHHPGGAKQGYSRGWFRTDGPECLGPPIPAPRSRFVYSELEIGSTVGGSSGSPVLLGNGQVVGQLLGACGPNAQDECDRRNHEVDGALYATYPQVAEWLDPAIEEAPCEPDQTTMCLHGDRFRVEVEWRNFEGQTGLGRVVPFGSNGSGLFWFFEPENWEMLVKVLDACWADNPRFWVFAAATTDVEYTLRVTDTQAGVVWQRTNALGKASPAITDTDAFATCE